MPYECNRNQQLPLRRKNRIGGGYSFAIETPLRTFDIGHDIIVENTNNSSLSCRLIRSLNKKKSRNDKRDTMEIIAINNGFHTSVSAAAFSNSI